MSDIRLTNVRAWLDGVRIAGADTDDEARLSIDIVHTGPDAIVDPADKLFSFVHAPVTKIFSYYPDQLPKDPKDFPPTQAIFTDKVIGQNNDRPTYALIGPFTTWEVRLVNSYKAKVGLLDELEKYKSLLGSYAGLQGKDITCEYPFHSPIIGKVGTVKVTDSAVTFEVLNIVKRVADILKIEGARVTSQKVLMGAEMPHPNDAISFSSDSDGPKVDFSNFTGIRLEFCGKAMGFSE